MGLLDTVRDRLDMIDTTEEHLHGHGFDPAACGGGEYRDTSQPDKPCTLCGCPTTPLAPMDLGDAPPASCARLDEHARGP